MWWFIIIPGMILALAGLITLWALFTGPEEKYLPLSDEDHEYNKTRYYRWEQRERKVDPRWQLRENIGNVSLPVAFVAVIALLAASIIVGISVAVSNYENTAVKNQCDAYRAGTELEVEYRQHTRFRRECVVKLPSGRWVDINTPTAQDLELS